MAIVSDHVMHQERRGDEVLTLSLPVGAKVLSWKVLVGSRVKKGSSLCTYNTCTDVKTLVSPLIGIIDTINVKEGDTVSSGDVGVVSVRKYCDHSVVALDLCAFCGLDLRSISSMSDRGTEDHANVSMLHGMPQVKVNKKEAQRLGNLDKECLLKNRKLALIIDLDQTLIHTSIDRNIERGLPDVYSFTLPGHSCIYHCRLRPYVREFLNHISQYYELHVATMGTRDYADAITKILDKEKRLFSHRVISRNELLDPHSKAVRLKSVFPCGDEMVAIMDDRGDVWGHRPNLIHVKAYVFFAGTDDINAPPLSPPTAPPTSTVPPPNSISDHPPQETREDHGNVSSPPSNSNSNNNTDKGGNGNGNKDGKTSQTEGATGDTTNTTSTPPLSLPSTTAATSTAGGSTATAATSTPGSTAAPGSSISGEARGQANGGKDDTSSSQPLPFSSTVNEDRATHTTASVHDGSTNNETISSNAINDAMVVNTTDAMVTTGGPASSLSSIPPGDETHDLADYNVSSSSSSSSSSDSSDDDDDEDESMDTGSTLTQNNPQSLTVAEPSPPDTAVEIHAKPRPVINDPDKFLVYLQDLLERIHETFYKEYDETKREEEKKGGGCAGSESLSSPDLKVIIPSLRKSVFSGLRLLFTGIIPTNMNPEKSREWNTTRAFGGEIHSTLITTPAPDDEHTTHVIVGKKDTDKYKQALRISRVEIVSPEWFWDCAERWKRLDEDEYRLDGERKEELKQETSQTTLKDNKKINDVKRRKGRSEEERDSKGKRKMTPLRQKAKLRHDTTPPPFERKFSVSSAELELMEAEIDAELETDDDDDDDDDERIGSYIQPVRDEDGDSFNAYLGLEEPSQSRSSSRKRKRMADDDPCSSDSISDSTSDGSYDELSALLEFT